MWPPPEPPLLYRDTQRNAFSRHLPQTEVATSFRLAITLPTDRNRGILMFNRRTFLKNGAAALPLATALNGLDPASATSGNDVAAIVSDPAPKLIPLPPRRASLDLATQPWQKKVRRVGQSNMTEHDPAVMNIEEWADYWHSAGADMVFVSVT